MLKFATPATQPTFLVVGDEMEDRWYRGTVSRVSPEAPIPVVEVQEVIKQPGGAANVTRNLRALGAKVVTAYGEGKPIKNRLVVGDYQLARWDEADRCKRLTETKLAGILEWNATPTAIVVADYLKGTVGEGENTVRMLEEMRLPTFVDTKGSPWKWGWATAVFPNNAEMERYRQLYNKHAQTVVWKRGADGLEERFDNALVERQPALARKVKSVAGAGDTVVAAYAYAKVALAGQISPLRFAAAAAALAVEEGGTSAPTLAAIEERLLYESIIAA